MGGVFQSIGIAFYLLTLGLELGDCQYLRSSNLVRNLQSSYVKHVPPTRDVTSHVIVNVHPSIISVDDVDAKASALVSTISLSLRWLDERLSWKPSENGDVRTLHLPATDVWTPDINVHNTVVGDKLEQKTNRQVEVSYTGHVTLVLVMHVHSYCLLDFGDFPYDIHQCDVILGSWLYTSKIVHIEFWDGMEGEMSVPVQTITDPALPHRDPGNWYVLSQNAKAVIRLVTYQCCPDEPYSQLRLTLRVKRNAPLLSVILALQVLVFSALLPIVFLLAPVNTARHVLALVTLCSHVSQLYILTLYLPTRATLPTIGVILAVDACCAGFAVILSGVLASCRGRYCTVRPPPAPLRKIASAFSCGCDEKLTSTNNGNDPYSQEAGCELTCLDNEKLNHEVARAMYKTLTSCTTSSEFEQQWNTIFRVIDRFFCFMSIILFILNIAILVS